MTRALARCALLLALAPSPLAAQAPRGLQPADLARLETFGDVQLSSTGRLAYSVTKSDRPGRPYSETRIRVLAGGAEVTLPPGASSPRWSPDGSRLAFMGRTDEGAGLVVANADGTGARLLAAVEGTNHPLPSSGESMAWSPDGTAIAFVSATPGPEADANGDPMVIDRYLYKPHAGEGSTRANDNRRLHLFVVDVATKAVRQLTDGSYYEHSIDWSPKGDEILFVSNREPDPDRVFNYDVFAVDATSKAVRRLTNTKAAEYTPKWSPDGSRIAFLGTTRELTSSETTMEDTHVWTMAADGTGRLEIGTAIDNRQGAPRWSPDGKQVYFTVQDRGSVRLMRLPAEGGAATRAVDAPATVNAWSASREGVAYALTGADGRAALWMAYASPAATPRTQKLVTLNAALLGERDVAPVEALTFRGPTGLEVEAFVTLPLGRTAGSSHPLIVMIHGGPHGQQGPAFNAKAQVYAGLGWASLMVNYRGSTGYGQKHADAIFGDQNGAEAEDVLAGVDAALAKHAWLDGGRLGVEGGSYGGQLANWLVTRTDRFKASIPSAGIANLVSFHYMAYYHDYLPVEYGRYPHERGLVDQLWDRSPLKYAYKVKTPTMFIHGENDNDVPIAESEQFYIALHEVGVPTRLVRYPREGHGLREPGHVIDALERSIAWYRQWLQ
jgi:dipeptidyl aminopeptidase/acylaminoacyl peptidase